MGNQLHRVQRLSGVFLQDRTERLDKQIRVSLRKNQRRSQLNHIVVRPIGPCQNAAFAQPVHDVIRFFGGRFPSRAIANQIDSQEQPGSADIADQGVALL